MMIVNIGNGDLQLILLTICILEFRVSGVNSLHFVANGNEITCHLPEQHTYDIGIEE